MSLLVIIHNLYVPRVIFMPAKTNAVLIIDADAMVSMTISLQSFKVISRRTSEIAKGFCKINCTEPAGCDAGDAAIFPTATRRKNLPRFVVLKITDHTYSVSRTTLYTPVRKFYSFIFGHMVGTTSSEFLFNPIKFFYVLVFRIHAVTSEICHLFSQFLQ